MAEAAILKTVKSPYLSNRLTDSDEIWHADADWGLADRGRVIKIFNFSKKKQDGGGRYFQKHKSRYHNKGLTDLREIWHHYAKFVS